MSFLSRKMVFLNSYISKTVFLFPELSWVKPMGLGPLLQNYLDLLCYLLTFNAVEISQNSLIFLTLALYLRSFVLPQT